MEEAMNKGILAALTLLLVVSGVSHGRAADEAAPAKSDQSFTESAVGAGRAVKDTAVDVGYAAKDAAVGLGHAVKDTAVTVGRGAKEVAIDAGHAVRDAAKGVGEAVRTGKLPPQRSDTTKVEANP
jgi:hypothetical protein